MKPLPIQKRALLKRTALLNAARQDFSEYGFEITTAKSIAGRAGVAIGTFYQYFDDKNDILRVLASNRMELLSENVELYKISVIVDSGGVVEEGGLNNGFEIEARFRQALSFIYQFHCQDPELHQVLEERRNNDPLLKTILVNGEEILLQRVLRFVQCFNLSKPEIVAANLFAMAEGLVHRHVFGDDQSDVNDVVGIGAQMLAAYFYRCADFNRAKV
ncbi:MAG: AcrR family transcriptional regulator [Arenicella sp.]|jgi:AcrR family transcriptional regulator